MDEPASSAPETLPQPGKPRPPRSMPYVAVSGTAETDSLLMLGQMPSCPAAPADKPGKGAR